MEGESGVGILGRRGGSAQSVGAALADGALSVRLWLAPPPAPRLLCVPESCAANKMGGVQGVAAGQVQSM